MRVPMSVCPVLVTMFVLGGVAWGEEAAEAPPAIAKFSEKKFSHEQYRAAILGKVSFRKGRKPVEPKEPLRVTFVRTDVKGAVVPIEVKEGEGFILQAVPGTWEVREIARAGRLYRTNQQFQVTAGNVVYIGFADIALGDEDRSAYSYEYRLDSTVSVAAFARHPELGKLINAWAPASFFTNDNVSLFAPTYAVASAEVKEPKTLAAASEHGDVATARELLAAGADPNTLDADGWTPLHSALRFGHKEIAELLLDRGASTSAVNPDGWTPLMLAVRNDQAANARLLLEKGASVDARAKSGTSALMLAAGFSPEDVVAALLDKGADVGAKDGDGWTALPWALRYQRRGAARRLVEKGSDVQSTDNEGWTPLMFALRYEQQDMAILLLEKGARANERNKSGWSPLHFALRNGATQAGRRLIEAGADRDRPTSDGLTPLMLALQYEQGDNARLLIEKGVDVEARNKDGWTPLMLALRYNQAECARLLLSKSKRIDDKNKDGWTALMVALRNGQAEAAEALLNRGAAFDYKVEGGWDCLLTALRNGQPENARRLIQKGANVNARTAQGWTALMFAIEYDQPENAKLLLEKGADATVRNADGGTALSLAKKKGLFEISRLLGDTEPGPSAFAPTTSGPALPAAIAAAVKLPAGTTVVSAGDCTPGLNGVAQCVVTIEAAGRRAELYESFVGSLKGAGWAFDKGTHARTEDGTVPGGGWGFLGFKKKQADGLATMTITFPSGASAANGRTRVDVGYQVFPHELKRVTYSQVLASYPAEAKQCGTWIDVTGVSPSGEWRTMGIVDYVNFKPQLQCLGTRVTLKISLAVGGVQYDAGTMLTVDKDQKWIAVTSWD